MRQPFYAGKFYKDIPEQLMKQIKECFEGEHGPGSLPGKEHHSIKAIIVPHAGYQYSGQCAAWGYRALAESPLADVYVILAPSHQSMKSGIATTSYKSPFGPCLTDRELAEGIIKKGNIEENNDIHEYEHSLEVQIPFLQFSLREKIKHKITSAEEIAKKERKKKEDEKLLKILPVLVSEDINFQKVALDIEETLMEQNKKAIYIVSSDFTHHGPAFNYIPFNTDVQQKIHDFDRKAIKFIEEYNDVGFVNYVKEHHATICGAMPVCLLLNILKKGKVTLENYYTSAEITGDEKNSVSYASIVFW